MNGLTGALNSRLTNAAAAVPITEKVLILAEAPAPLPPREAMRVLPPAKPGQLGGHSMDVYPDVEYTPGAFKDLLQRAINGCNYMIEHLSDGKGAEQIGFFADLMEATHCMALAHGAKGILERP